MKLYIAGINHFDALCIEKLNKWMEEIKELESNSPNFVAPEWKYEHFITLKAQRIEFDKVIRSEWPNLNESQIEKIVLSLGYEGDTHLNVFGELPLVWLDEKRIDAAIVADDYYRDRFSLLQSCSKFKKDDEELLSAISTELKLRHIPSINEVRDNIFYQAIKAEAGPRDEGWGIVIVGANHAVYEPGTMRHLLESAGYECVVKDLAVSN